MLINKDSAYFKGLCVIRKSQRKHEAKGNFVKGRTVSDTFNKLVMLVAADLVKQIDEANKEQGEWKG